MRNIAIKYGLMMFVGFTLYFLFMKVIGLAGNYNFRIFNGIIHILLIYFAISAYQKASPEGEFNYLSGTAAGVMASFFGVLAFSIFQWAFLNLNPDFMLYLQGRISLGANLTPFTSSLIIFMEGMAISVIGSYIVMRVVEMRLIRRYET